MPETNHLKYLQTLNQRNTEQMVLHYMQQNKNYNVVLRDKCAESL